MADLQPRRYITRARAQAGVSAPSSSGTQRNTRSVVTGAKRKALAESTLALENTRSKTDEEPALPPIRATRTTTLAKPAGKKPAVRAKATVSSSLSVAPRRSERTGNKRRALSPNRMDAKTICARTLAHGKKVTFACPKSASEDKENDVPAKVSAEPEKAHHPNETDVLMSTSMGALSVKPRRIPKTKLQQPSTGIFADAIPALPALSPQKVRRPKRVCTVGNDDLQDELLCPTSPRLAEKPRRPLPSMGKRSAIDGAGLLIPSKASQKPSVLFGSPARRFPQSPAKPKDSTSSSSSQVSPSKPTGLSSPARRPQGSGLNFGMSISKPVAKGSSLKFCITNSSDTPSDSFSGDTNKPLIVDDDVFNSRPIPQRKLIAKREPSEENPKKEATGNVAFKDLLASIKREKQAKAAAISTETLVTDEKSDVDHGVAGSEVSTSPPAPSSKEVDRVTPPSRLPKPQASVKAGEDPARDMDGDISMGGIENSTQSILPSVPRVKKHRSPREGGSSFGLFDLGEDGDDEDDDLDCNSENVPPPQVLTTLGSKLDDIEFEKPAPKDSNRGFGQEIDICVNPAELQYAPWDGVPVDPMLLSEDISDVVIGYSEVSRPPVKVPVKFHDDDDDPFGDNNHYTLSADAFTYKLPLADEDAHHRRQSNDERSGGVLAGAVVYVDAFTNDGADCGDTFEKMLKGMGAKVLKSWTWNPDSPTPGKVGITHVVFKDGSPRTLQKVRAAGGLVSCVALRWVMECAGREEWLDESEYAIDLNDIPRGCQRRRKSMEPQRTEDLIAQLNSPNPSKPLKTPKRMQPSQLVPKTVPPQLDIASASPLILERIRIARRKSMQHAPKVGSPLAKSWRAG